MVKLYVVHYKPKTKMFDPNDDPTLAHVNLTRYPELTKEYLDKDKQVDRWYWIER